MRPRICGRTRISISISISININININIRDSPSELGEGSNPYPVLMSKRITNKAAMPGGDSIAAREASMADFL